MSKVVPRFPGLRKYILHHSVEFLWDLMLLRLWRRLSSILAMGHDGVCVVMTVTVTRRDLDLITTHW